MDFSLRTSTGVPLSKDFKSYCPLDAEVERRNRETKQSDAFYVWLLCVKVGINIGKKLNGLYVRSWGYCGK